MSDLYEGDILLWSERQADLLRRRAAGEPVSETELDKPRAAPPLAPPRYTPSDPDEEHGSRNAADWRQAQGHADR